MSSTSMMESVAKILDVQSTMIADLKKSNIFMQQKIAELTSRVTALESQLATVSDPRR
jgi:polyhydroxyalkanoate synthesis regulator phasin